MTTLLQISIIFFVHVYFCILYLFFGVEEQEIADQQLQFNFGSDGVDFILYISLISILMVILARYTSVYIKFHNIKNIEKRVRIGIYISLIPLILFIYYLIVSAGGNYGILATQRYQNSFLIELRYIPYLLIIQYYSTPNQSNKIFIGFLILAAGGSILLYQARSIIFEVLIIIICIKARENMDRVKLHYFLWPIILIPLSNLAVAIRQKLSMEQYIQTMWEFEYLLIINNILGAMFYYDHDYTYMWLLERLVLVIPSPIRSLFGISNPSDEMFLDITLISGVSSGGFSYLGNMYLIFGNYFFFILYLIYLFLEILRKNFMLNTSNYVTNAYPILLACSMLAIRNDVGVLVKQIIQIIIMAVALNIISRMRWKK